MSTPGELFVTEILRDYLAIKHPDFKFVCLKCEGMYSLLSPSTYPHSFTVRAYDENNLHIANVKVFLKFSIKEDSNKRFIDTEIEKVEIVKVTHLGLKIRELSVKLNSSAIISMKIKGKTIIVQGSCTPTQIELMKKFLATIDKEKALPLFAK